MIMKELLEVRTCFVLFLCSDWAEEMADCVKGSIGVDEDHKLLGILAELELDSEFLPPGFLFVIGPLGVRRVSTGNVEADVLCCNSGNHVCRGELDDLQIRGLEADPSLLIAFCYCGVGNLRVDSDLNA